MHIISTSSSLTLVFVFESGWVSTAGCDGVHIACAEVDGEKRVTHINLPAQTPALTGDLPTQIGLLDKLKSL